MESTPDEPKVTIERLDIQLEVEGDDDAAFATLFRKYFGLYEAKRNDELERQRRGDRERALGDRGEGPR